jgi:hypothetical protein
MEVQKNTTDSNLDKTNENIEKNILVNDNTKSTQLSQESIDYVNSIKNYSEICELQKSLQKIFSINSLSSLNEQNLKNLDREKRKYTDILAISSYFEAKNLSKLNDLCKFVQRTASALNSIKTTEVSITPKTVDIKNDAEKEEFCSKCIEKLMESLIPVNKYCRLLYLKNLQNYFTLINSKTIIIEQFSNKNSSTNNNLSVDSCTLNYKWSISLSKTKSIDAKEIDFSHKLANINKFINEYTYYYENTQLINYVISSLNKVTLLEKENMIKQYITKLESNSNIKIIFISPFKLTKVLYYFDIELSKKDLDLIVNNKNNEDSNNLLLEESINCNNQNTKNQCGEKLHNNCIKLTTYISKNNKLTLEEVDYINNLNDEIKDSNLIKITIENIIDSMLNGYKFKQNLKKMLIDKKDELIKSNFSKDKILSSINLSDYIKLNNCHYTFETEKFAKDVNLMLKFLFKALTNLDVVEEKIFLLSKNERLVSSSNFTNKASDDIEFSSVLERLLEFNVKCLDEIFSQLNLFFSENNFTHLGINLIHD